MMFVGDIWKFQSMSPYVENLMKLNLPPVAKETFKSLLHTGLVNSGSKKIINFTINEINSYKRELLSMDK